MVDTRTIDDMKQRSRHRGVIRMDVDFHKSLLGAVISASRLTIGWCPSRLFHGFLPKTSRGVINQWRDES